MVDVEDDRTYTRGNSRKDKDVMPGRQGNFPGQGEDGLVGDSNSEDE